MDDTKFLFPPEFWGAVYGRYRAGQRWGQAVFNTAYENYPQQSDFLRTTSYDPFYDDSRVNAFLTVLYERISGIDGRGNASGS